MDRVILGTAAAAGDDTSQYYHRSGEPGMFVSRAGANASNCSIGSLIFDSISNDFFQILAKGSVVVEKADNKTTAKETGVFTATEVPYSNNQTVLVSWNVMSNTTDLHSSAFPLSWNTGISESKVVVSVPFINLDFTTITSPFDTGFVPGATLTATTKANTTFYPTVANTVDIFFTNGSPNFDHTVQWMLFRVQV